MTRETLFYLGPEGTFTHQAAMEAADQLTRAGVADDGFTLRALDDVPAIMRAVEHGEGWGVVAWENNVEGYVVPNLDALIDARDVAGFARVRVDVAFDAFTRHGDDPLAARAAHVDGGVADDAAEAAGATPTIPVSAHPHGLAQCKRFIAAHGLTPTPASSNAAACRDLEPGGVALGPHICGELYGLDTFAARVQDFEGAHTDFLVLGTRDDVRALNAHARTAHVEFETILTLIPLVTGPGVLADVLDVLRDAGLNMTSFISRPIKGTDGTYSFIATIDAAPWEPRFRAVLKEIAEHGDWLKTLAVYPRRERPNPPVETWRLPDGGVRLEALPGAGETGDGAAPAADWDAGHDVRRELLW